MQINIDNTNVAERIVYNTFRIDNILTSQVDICTFTIRCVSTDIYRPNMGQEIIVLDDSGTRIFAGVITRRTQNSPSFGVIEYAIECTDYTKILDQKLVATTYENMTVEDIIANLIATYTTDFTTTQVSCMITISYIQFAYLPISECLKQLADLVGFDWYVDYTKDVYFQTPSANTAPVEIQDDNGTYADGTLIIRDDNSQLRTAIVVRGGEYLGSQFTASAKADGHDVTFKLPYKYTDFGIRVNGKKQTIGVDYIDDPATFSALFNFEEKIVRWRDDNKPVANDTLSFSGKPNLPVIVKYSDPIAVAAIFSAEGYGDGKYEYLINDSTINSQVGARQRAAAEIQTYGATLSEGEFETETPGFLAGQRVLINSVSRNINQEFVVNKVTTTMKTPTSFIYKISLINTKTMDYLAILKKLLYKDRSKIDLSQTEQLDLIESEAETVTIGDAVFTADHNMQNETVTMNETFTAQSLNFPVVFVLGPFLPTGFKRVFITNGSKLS
ncbi:MAG TPA: hypothetical protein VFX17_02105 [Patescibacteria group bacterium]|nr:hypothetical protein [Patescibacteria group bacterium]